MRLIVAFWMLGLGLVLGQKVPVCVSCEEPLEAGAQFVYARPAAFLEPQPLCRSCSTLDRHCFECGLPVKVGFQSLGDGRVVCRRHGQAAVKSLQDAEGLFKEVKRDLMHMLRGSSRLPDEGIRIGLADQREMGRLIQQGEGGHSAKMTMGLTVTREEANGRQWHRIFILSGMSRARFAAVAAHEYGHAWMSENVGRSVEGKTVEAFCELVAYRLMKQRNERAQMQVILANAYTDGKISILKQATDDLEFHRVVEWMKSGSESALRSSAREEVLALRPEAAPSLFALPPSGKTAVPDTLELKGISGAGKRRFALVNDRTLALHEQGRVRVGEGSVTVRCLEIGERSVRLRMVDTGEERELFMRTD